MCDRTLKRLQTRLDLTQEQVGRIKPIVEQNSAAIQNLQRESWLKVSDTFKRMNAQIASYLTDDQRLRLDAMETERCEKVRKKCASPRGETNAAHTGQRK